MCITNEMKEVCANCGCTKGSHLATAYDSHYYKRWFPAGYCSGDEGRMNWDKGPGTTFKPSGEYKEEK